MTVYICTALFPGVYGSFGAFVVFFRRTRMALFADVAFLDGQIVRLRSRRLHSICVYFPVCACFCVCAFRARVVS